MQNKPNFQTTQMNVSPLIQSTTNYELRTDKNKPNSNPIQTQPVVSEVEPFILSLAKAETMNY